MKLLTGVTNFFKTLFGFIISKYFIIHFSISVVIFALIIWGSLFALRTYTRHNESLVVPNFTGLERHEAKELIKRKELRFDIIDSVYYAEVPPGAIVEQYPNPGARVKKNRRILFTVRTFEPEYVEIPNVIGVSVIQAITDLKSHGLETGILEYVDSEFKNLVLNQKLKEKDSVFGEKVPRGTTIDLVLGRGDDNLTYIPLLVGTNVDKAKEKAARALLNIGSVIYDKTVETRKDTLDARIWKQFPHKSEENKVEPGTFIDLWLTTNDNKVKLGRVAEEEAVIEQQLKGKDTIQ